MTIQEFVKKEAAEHYLRSIEGSNLLSGNDFEHGLTKGLEIAKDAILFIANCTEETANEIVQKVITEKYGK